MIDRVRPNQGESLVVVSGPSGVGKSTVVRALLERMSELSFSVSATTRPPRKGETEGTDYHFLSREEFERRIADGGFIEHAEVFGHLYGTPVEELERAEQSGRMLLMEIDVQGGIQIRQRFSKALLILLIPPSLEVVRERLAGRGTEDAEALEARFNQANEELRSARKSGAYDAVVVNDTLEDAVRKAETLIRKHRRTSHD